MVPLRLDSEAVESGEPLRLRTAIESKGKAFRDRRSHGCQVSLQMKGSLMERLLVPYKLVLEDGTIFPGISFASPRSVTGEVVFNTGMTGYVETLSDPSYKGQILVLTYPLMGNYGIPPLKAENGLALRFESSEAKILGLVVNRYEEKFSHHEAVRSLGQWLNQCQVPAIFGVDTRRLTKRLREQGTMRGKLCPMEDNDSLGQDCHDLAAVVPLVSTPTIEKHSGNGKSGKKVLVVDCGVKHSIVRSLLVRGVEVIRVPFDHDFAEDDRGSDGFLISNGPGDPTNLPITIANIRKAMKKNKPIFGICLGHQLLTLAAGGATYKLRYGHRSQNQPVQSLIDSRSFVTSQNHGYAVDRERIPSGFEEWFVNVNDGTNEGIRHRTEPWRSVQFHPEACPGPVESQVLFDEFVEML